MSNLKGFGSREVSAASTNHEGVVMNIDSVSWRIVNALDRLWMFLVEYKVEVLAISAVVGLLVTASIALHETPEQQYQLYNTWMKIHPNIELTQEEWQALRREHLLPGQAPKDDADLALGIAVGTAVGTAASMNSR